MRPPPHLARQDGAVGRARALNPVIGGERHAAGSLDARIAALAGRQHGVVARTQLLALGAGRRAVEHRIARGRLHPVHRGVYAVGHRVLSRDGRWMAALLSVGADAVLSHRSAAVLWGLRSAAPQRVEVTVCRALRTRSDVRVHRGLLASDETTALRGMGITTAARTLLDLACVVARAELERALNEAEVLRLADPLPLGALLDRHGRRPGTATLRAILARGELGATVTRSELEDRFLAFVEEASLPRPEVNAVLTCTGGSVEVDCLWRDRRLVAELDGQATHGTRAAFERDRVRDRLLQADGWRVVRITWRALHEDRGRLAVDLTRLLDPRR
jgi:hypothetical protein